MADLTLLVDEFREPFEEVVQTFLNVTGQKLLVTSTLRTLDEQAKLYRQGHSTASVIVKADALTSRGFDDLSAILMGVGPIPTGQKVTNAGPGESWHNWGMAADVVPIVNGHAVWDADDPLWQEYGRLLRLKGLYWGDAFGDLPHAQLHREGNPLDVFTPTEVIDMISRLVQ